MVMVEQDLPAGIKLLLDHPRWHQRVNVLIGSGHKVNDLARAKSVNNTTRITKLLVNMVHLGQEKLMHVLFVQFDTIIVVMLL